MEDPYNYEARGALMLLSPLAINGIMKVGRWGRLGCHDINMRCPVNGIFLMEQDWR